MYALIEDSLVKELLETDLDISTIFVPEFIWVDVTNVQDIKQGWVATQVGTSWSFTEYVAPPPTPEEILASQTIKLQGLTQVSIVQKTALANRVSTINDAIELEMATEEEEAELPVRVLQLKAWKTYGVLLGRVTAQANWPTEVVWPVQPTEGM
jgi:hypothetical protein